jgi:hypothetical protein
MWPLPSINQKHVYLTIFPQELICADLSHAKNQLSVRAFKKIPISAQSTLPIVLKEIKDFLRIHNLQNSYAHIALMPPLIYENCFILSKASASFNDFNLPEFKKMKWNYSYLHPAEENKHSFYFSAIPSSLLFYYQLIALAAQSHLLQITTHYVCLIHAYKKIYGAAFRQTQLATDLQRTSYNIEKIFSTDSLARLIKIPPLLKYEKEKLALLTLVGLYQLKESFNEH